MRGALSRPALAGAALAVLVGCTEAYLELQIADPDLPLLEAGRDFDALLVEARAEGCADNATRYPAAPLPATLAVVPRECYQARLDLRAAAISSEQRIAESSWIPVTFPESGFQVVTATLGDRPGRRPLFLTGFEVGDPASDRTELPVVLEEGFDGLVAATSEEGALIGARSALISGVATSTAARVLARLASTNVVLARGDELIINLELASGSTIRAVGIELELNTGATARSLRLSNHRGEAIEPGDTRGRAPGVRQQWIVDLSPAAGARLVGILLGSDLRGEARGVLEVRADDLAIVRP